MSSNLRKDLKDIAKALGISSDGKTTTQLGALIKAATKNFPASAPGLINPNALSKHFEEGRFTDCTIRVKIKDCRPAKRLRSGRSKATKPDGPAAEAEDVHVIKAHAVILASRSAYFERAMGSEWRESQNRSFEVEVADETEYLTFYRLIKLCYGSTFIKEGDRDLDVSELVRLIHVANAFECMDAVKHCTSALQGGDLDWEEAEQCLELTDMLKDVEGMAGLAEKATYVIVEGVGLVHELFVPVEDEEDGGDVLGGLRLSERVKHLPPRVFEALLSSKGLQLKTENERFWLLLAWVEAQSEESEEGKQALFNRMAGHLRFFGMDPGYILLLVSTHPRIIAAGLERTALRASLTHSNLARRTVQEVGMFDVEAMRHAYAPMHCLGGATTWVFNVSFTAAEVATIGNHEGKHKIVGLVAGLPWYVELVRDDSGSDGGFFEAALYTMCHLPFEWMTFEDRGGFYFQYTLEVGVDAPDETIVDEGGDVRCWTTSPEFARGGTLDAWQVVFGRRSGWLVKGELRIKLTVTTTNDQGPSMSTDAIASLEAEQARLDDLDEVISLPSSDDSDG